jgi:hypothetical protein
MSDYSSPYTDEDERLDAKRWKIMRDLHALPVRDLTVGDLLQIIGILFHRYFGPSAMDIETLEDITKRGKA